MYTFCGNRGKLKHFVEIGGHMQYASLV